MLQSQQFSPLQFICKGFFLSLQSQQFWYRNRCNSFYTQVQEVKFFQRQPPTKKASEHGSGTSNPHHTQKHEHEKNAKNTPKQKIIKRSIKYPSDTIKPQEHPKTKARKQTNKTSEPHQAKRAKENPAKSEVIFCYKVVTVLFICLMI